MSNNDFTAEPMPRRTGDYVVKCRHCDYHDRFDNYTDADRAASYHNKHRDGHYAYTDVTL